MKTPFKVCCMQSPEEADMAIAAGAGAVGLVGAMPNGPGPIDDLRIREIAAHVGARWGSLIWTTLLTSRTDGEAIAEHVRQTGVNTVQIVDAPEDGAYSRLRRAHPALRIIQVIHVEGEQAIETARRTDHAVDFILLDSGTPSAATRTLGGTGNVHDWSISQRLVERVRSPVFLAGGLTPDNAAEALRRVRPYGLDVCSGLRDAKRGYALNEARLRAFASALAL